MGERDSLQGINPFAPQDDFSTWKEFDDFSFLLLLNFASITIACMNKGLQKLALIL